MNIVAPNLQAYANRADLNPNDLVITDDGSIGIVMYKNLGKVKSETNELVVKYFNSTWDNINVVKRKLLPGESVTITVT